ncbi:MAG: hypothetical protein ABUL61_05020, partial [Oleiharenicola lentus]
PYPIPMRPRYRLLVVALAVAGLQPALRAQATAGTPVATSGDVPKQKSRVSRQLAELVKADAGIVSITPRAEETEVPSTGEILVLEPLVVTGKVDLPPPVHETRVQEFFRTGTLWEKVGSKFTRKFWVKGDRGIMFTLSW